MADETFDVLLRVKAEGDEALKVLTKQLAIVQTETKKTQQALQQTGEGGNRFRYSLQNLGFQAQDFAVQVGGGTSALRAFSQQMPQAIDALQNMFGEATALGKFLGGPWGVFLGLAAAVVGPLIAQLVGAGEAADKSAEQLDRFATSANLAKTAGEVMQMVQALGMLQNEYRRAAGASKEAQAFFANTVRGKQLKEQIELQQFEIEQTRNIIALRDKQIRQNEAAKDAADQAKKDARTAATEARKAATEQAAEARKAQREAEAAAKKVNDLVTRFRTSINDVLQANDEALRKYIETINDAADPTLAYAEGVRQLAEAQESGGVTAEAAALQQQKLADTLDSSTLALIKLRDQAAGGVGESFAKWGAEFTASLDSIKQGWADIGKEASDALAGMISGTMKASDAFRSLLADVLKLLAKMAVVRLFTGSKAGSFGAEILKAFSAKGNIFSPAGVVPFAQGGIVTSPTIFPFANGVGMMGEAGPEAIVPMRRDSQGRLGVGAMPVNIAIHNNAGAAVSVRETGPGQVDIIIARAVEASRSAIAQDFRRGGADVSRAVERAYGINRGAGAF